MFVEPELEFSGPQGTNAITRASCYSHVHTDDATDVSADSRVRGRLEMLMYLEHEPRGELKYVQRVNS